MADPIHILITGGGGQIGHALTRIRWPDHVVLHAPDRRQLDIGDAVAVRRAFAETPFAAVINAAAYTAVDKAETEVVEAFAANAMAPAILAEETHRSGAPLIHVSTDYVFDGARADAYVEEDAVGPLGVYGASKLAGEWAVRAGNPRSVVLRTAWVMGGHRTNFLKTMLQLAETHETVRVVRDQRGSPTSAHDVAAALRDVALAMIADPSAATGVYHFVNAGEASWAEAAQEIFRLSVLVGGPSATVEPIPATDYPAAARRPSNSRLSTAKLARDYGITPRDWREAIADIVSELHKTRAVA